MARTSVVINKNDWREMFDGFCDEVYHKVRKPIPYQNFRQIKDGPMIEAQISVYDDKSIEVYNVGRTGHKDFDMYVGTIEDGSFGSYLYDYFQEVLKPMHEEKKEYDIWGLTSKIDNSCTACSALNSVDGVAADKVSTVTAWTGDPYYNYADSATSAVSYQTLPDANRERIEALEHQVEVLDAKSAAKVNRADFEHELDTAIEDVLGAVDETRYELSEIYDRIIQLEEKQARMPTFTTVSTSSEYYPKKNFKLNIADLEIGCDDNRKEKENMDTNKMFNGFEFGPVDDRVKMSPYGMAIRNADGRYVSYDPKTANIVDVEVFNFDNHNLIYKMPVAVSAIVVGDTVIHMKKPMFVTSVTNGITVIDIFNGEVKTIMPATNMFGFNFVTKVVSLFSFTGANTPTAENPFGNVLPFMLMGDNKDFKDILPLMLMTGNTGMFGNMAQNPLMLYALMGEKSGNIDPLMMVALTGGFNGVMPTASSNICNCGGNCGQHNQ